MPAKKTPAQLQRDIDEALAGRHKQARDRWLSLQAGPRHRERQAAYGEMAALGQELNSRGAKRSHATMKKAAPTAGTGKRMDRKKLGELMGPWGSDFSFGEGSGAVGAVSSYYFSDHRYPERKWVERALKAIEDDVPKAELGAHGWTKADAKDLRRIAQGLRYYLNHDYK